MKVGDNLNHIKLYERDNFTCLYCGEQVIVYYPNKNTPMPNNIATLDHIIPKSKGGNNNEYNLATCCYRCNCILGRKGYHKKHNNILMTFKSKRKIIKEMVGYTTMQTPQFLKDYHKSLIFGI
mgnify:CR=1 FL=1